MLEVGTLCIEQQTHIHIHMAMASASYSYCVSLDTPTPTQPTTISKVAGAELSHVPYLFNLPIAAIDVLDNVVVEIQNGRDDKLADRQ